MFPPIVNDFFDIKVSSDLSFKMFLVENFYSAAFFGILMGALFTAGLPSKFFETGLLIYILLTIFCDAVFIIKWNIFIPEVKRFARKYS